MIAFHTQKSTMDDDAVMERASELGMIMPETQIPDSEPDTAQAEPATQPDTQPVPDTNTKKSDVQNDKNLNKNNTDSDKKSDTEEGSGSKTDEVAKDPVDSKKNEDQKNESEEVTVTIKKGEVCRQLAENLAELGLVEDAETFRKYMQQCGYDDQIRVGTYQLKRGMTQEEIAKVFVTK